MRELAAPLGSAAMERALFVVSGVYGFLAVALGAFGAHALRPVFARAADAAKRLEWWQTASHYHLAHSGAILIAAGAKQPLPAALFAAGTLLFSGSLYALVLSGYKALGAVTPVGGLLLTAGWLALLL